MVSAQATTEPAPEPRPGPTGNALRLRPLDEVGDDQEVAGILHPLDDAELVLEALAVVVLGLGPAQGRAPQGASERPVSRGLAKQRRLGVRRRRRVCVAAGEARQDRLPGPAARRRRASRSRPCSASLRAGRRTAPTISSRGLEIMLRRQPPPVVVGDDAPFGDADQRVMRLVILALREKGLVGGDERQAVAIGEIEQMRLDRPPRRRCRDAEARHRAGRRRAAPAGRAAAAARSSCPAAIARSIGPPGPPVSAISPRRGRQARHRETCGRTPGDRISMKEQETSRTRFQ